jgi:hypothetical protein
MTMSPGAKEFRRINFFIDPRAKSYFPKLTTPFLIVVSPPGFAVTIRWIAGPSNKAFGLLVSGSSEGLEAITGVIAAVGLGLKPCWI